MFGNSHDDEKAVAKGVLTLICFHAVALVIASIFYLFIGFAAYGRGSDLRDHALALFLVPFCLWQFLYVVPLAMRLQYKRQFNVLKGVVFGVLLTFLIDGSFYTLRMLMSNR